MKLNRHNLPLLAPRTGPSQQAELNQDILGWLQWNDRTMGRLAADFRKYRPLVQEQKQKQQLINTST